MQSPGTPSKESLVPDGLSPIFGASPFKKCGELSGSETVGDTIKNFITTFKNIISARFKRQLVQYKHMVIEIGGMSLFKFVGNS